MIAATYEEFARLNRTIHPNDGMQRYAPHFYFDAGAIALRQVRLAMQAAQMYGEQPRQPKRILDMGSGYGRVSRWFVSAFPGAEVTACDIQKDAVYFCVQAFGVKGIVSREDPDEIPLEGQFDVIWSGSLLTHVDDIGIKRFLRLFERVLAPGGVAVFTTFGRFAVEKRLRPRNLTFSLNEEQVVDVLKQYDQGEYGFCDALSQQQGAYRSGWGDAFVSPSWVCRAIAEAAPKLNLLVYSENAWGMRRDEWSQDVIACTRSPD